MKLSGFRYCVARCLEQALRDVILSRTTATKPPVTAHRLPLGLLLLSRQQLTAEQLRVALEAQRAAGQGKIGEWLVALGSVTPIQVTAALARQWSCPVLRSTSTMPRWRRFPPLPISLLEQCRMIPIGYVESSSTLHIAFSEAVDYNLLYAIEQMTGCHTEPCMALPSFLETNLPAFSDQTDRTEMVFECGTQVPEVVRIICSYCARMTASEVRIAVGGPYLWARLLRAPRPALDLLFRSAECAIPVSQNLKFSPRLPMRAVVAESL